MCNIIIFQGALIQGKVQVAEEMSTTAEESVIIAWREAQREWCQWLQVLVALF